MKGDSPPREFALNTELSDSFISKAKAVNEYIDKFSLQEDTAEAYWREDHGTGRQEGARAVAGYPVDKLDWETMD